MLSYLENKIYAQRAEEVSSLKIAKVQNIVTTIFCAFTKFFLRPIVTGEENLELLAKMISDTGKGVLIVSNHLTKADPFFICSLMPKDIFKKIVPIIFLGKQELFMNKILGEMVAKLGCIPATGFVNVRETIKQIKEGGRIFFFPEGQRSPDGKIGKDGGQVKKFSQCCSFILQPIRIEGIKMKEWIKIILFQRRLKICFGKPIEINGTRNIDAIEIIRSIKEE